MSVDKESNMLSIDCNTSSEIQKYHWYTSCSYNFFLFFDGREKEMHEYFNLFPENVSVKKKKLCDSLFFTNDFPIWNMPYINLFFFFYFTKQPSHRIHTSKVQVQNKKTLLPRCYVMLRVGDPALKLKEDERGRNNISTPHLSC